MPSVLPLGPKSTSSLVPVCFRPCPRLAQQPDCRGICPIANCSGQRRWLTLSRTAPKRCGTRENTRNQPNRTATEGPTSPPTPSTVTQTIHPNPQSRNVAARQELHRKPWRLGGTWFKKSRNTSRSSTKRRSTQGPLTDDPPPKPFSPTCLGGPSNCRNPLRRRENRGSLGILSPAGKLKRSKLGGSPGSNGFPQVAKQRLIIREVVP